MQRMIRLIGVVMILGACIPLSTRALAQDEQDEHAPPGAAHEQVNEDAGQGRAEGDHGAAAEHGGGHEADAGLHAAEPLAVGQPPAWYSKVVTGAIVLFVLAATLGSVAVLTKAPEPQEPDHHDDHGHDHGGHGHH